MKNLTLLLLALPLAAVPAMAGPFGLNIGEPFSRLHVIQHNADNSYRVAVPEPESEFRSYFVFMTPTDKVCKIIAAGKPHEREDTIDVFPAYVAAKSSLIRSYGKPADDLDFCKGGRGGAMFCFLGSIHGAKNVAQEIREKLLVLKTVWTGPQLSDHLEKISLTPAAGSFHETHLVLSFEGKDAEACPGAGSEADEEGG